MRELVRVENEVMACSRASRRNATMSLHLWFVPFLATTHPSTMELISAGRHDLQTAESPPFFWEMGNGN